MIDSNTYNEIMRMGCRETSDAPYSSADVENSPETRQIDNVAAMPEKSEDKRKKDHEKAIAYMNSPEARAFYKLLRRHEANVFNALFEDKEPITETDIQQRVRGAARFFELPIPTVIASSNCLAQITYSNHTELGSEIKYDIRKLEEIGINNVDAFDALITHELSHQFLSGYRFNFCRNINWSIELACDFIVGVRCSAGMIASGKYKYAVSRMRVTETHPEGSFRLKAVKSGFDYSEWLIRKNVRPMASTAIQGFNKFLCEHSSELNESFVRYMTAPPQPPLKERDIMDYPDSNLLKQYVMKHRAQQALNQESPKEETDE